MALSLILTLSLSFWNILAARCLQVTCVLKPNKPIFSRPMNTNPFLVAIVGGRISIVVYASLDGSMRPGCCHVVQEILGEWASLKFRHKLRDELFLPVLTTESGRIIESGLMQPCYGDTMSIRAKSYVLQSPPWASPADLSFWEC